MPDEPAQPPIDPPFVEVKEQELKVEVPAPTPPTPSEPPAEPLASQPAPLVEPPAPPPTPAPEEPIVQTPPSPPEPPVETAPIIEPPTASIPLEPTVVVSEQAPVPLNPTVETKEEVITNSTPAEPIEEPVVKPKNEEKQLPLEESTLPVASTPPVVEVTEQKLKDEEPVPVADDKIPQKILDLTPEELDIARKLWARKHIAHARAVSLQNRHTRRYEMLNNIQTYVHKHAPTTLQAVAYNMNISPRMASDYLRILTRTKRISASGNTSARQYR